MAHASLWQTKPVPHCVSAVHWTQAPEVVSQRGWVASAAWHSVSLPQGAATQTPPWQAWSGPQSASMRQATQLFELGSQCPLGQSPSTRHATQAPELGSQRAPGQSPAVLQPVLAGWQV